MKLSNSKFYKTFSNLSKIANHHFGKSRFPILKLLYYSFFRVNEFIAFYYPLDKSIPSAEIDWNRFTLYTNLEKLKEVRKEKDLPREFYYDEIHNNHKFYLLMCGDDVAYIHWIYIKGDKNRFLRLGDGDVELNYNTTMPRFRGHGLMNHMIRYILKDCKDKGYGMAYGVVHKDNIAALRNMDKCGFLRFRNIKTVGQLNFKINCTDFKSSLKNKNIE